MNHSGNGDGTDEGIGEEEGVMKPVLVILFDCNTESSIGLLSEQKVTNNFIRILFFRSERFRYF